jgi:hypothetical protein
MTKKITVVIPKRTAENTVDAKEPLTVNITASDIHGATLLNPESCAAARSVKRTLHCQRVEIYRSRTYVFNGRGKWVRYKTPRSLREETIVLDRGGKFQSGEYTFDQPEVRTYRPATKATKTTNKKSKVRRILADVRPRA